MAADANPLEERLELVRGRYLSETARLEDSLGDTIATHFGVSPGRYFEFRDEIADRLNFSNKIGVFVKIARELGVGPARGPLETVQNRRNRFAHGDYVTASAETVGDPSSRVHFIAVNLPRTRLPDRITIEELEALLASDFKADWEVATTVHVAALRAAGIILQPAQTSTDRL
jgi:hypothetical protein